MRYIFNYTTTKQLRIFKFFLLTHFLGNFSENKDIADIDVLFVTFQNSRNYIKCLYLKCNMQVK